VVAAGDAEQAVRMLQDVRDRFTSLEEPNEVEATDLVLAEILLDAGRPPEAAQLLDALGGDRATAQRLRGGVLAIEARWDEAASALSRGLDLARRESDRYEEALLLRALADLDHAAGLPDSAENGRRSQEILDSLGVVRLRGR